MSVPAHERLLDLIIALTQTHTAMTRAQIRTQVNGYAPEDGDPTTTRSFERMFERDKKMLKDLGVPLQTIHGSGYNDEIRYRVDVQEYALPPIDLTPAELGVLAVASHIWEGSVLARHARRALTKLRGVTATAAEYALSPQVQLSEPDHALPDIFEALSARRPVRFTYAAASTGTEGTRVVEPWQLLVKNQGWYLRGWDRDRKAGREFRLSRITSRVQVLSEEPRGPEPELVDPEDPVADARLAIRPGAGALLRARGEPVGSEGDWDVYTLPMADPLVFAGQIAEFGDRVKVLGPPELRDLVIAKLRGAAEATAEVAR